MKINAKSKEPVSINNTVVEEVEDFTYLGSKITSDGDSGKDVQSRLTKAKGAFAALKKIWRSKNISMKTKIKIFKSNIL